MSDETLDEFMERTKDSGISASARRMTYALSQLPLDDEPSTTLVIDDGFDI